MSYNNSYSPHRQTRLVEILKHTPSFTKMYRYLQAELLRKNYPNIELRIITTIPQALIIKTKIITAVVTYLFPSSSFTSSPA